ncbi:tRNA lysidine(34) synthetase TilS [Alloalcanivorax sp. C16-2]|uniref:tRNA lysidine(34) synthetase TilS n=1 Tax=Alloalcanivorax sp. C16-2 TaxID=3390052 RepID=UPI003970B904
MAPPTHSSMDELSAELARRAPPGPLWLAFSGGLDSTVLLHLLAGAGLGARLTALHVDHGLHPDSAAWAAHCQTVARHLGVAFESTKVTVDRAAGLEAGARDARYRALTARAGSATLITAHHRDDQAETLLLRLLRGAGVAGLAAIREHGRRGDTPLWRPLLGLSRRRLLERAEQGGWSWLEDPSNTDQSLDRNYLRGTVLPALSRRWPGVLATLARAADHQAEAAALLDERAAEDAAALGATGDRLALTVASLSGPRRRNLLRWWLREAGAGAPSQALLAQIEGLLAAPADRAARVEWGGWQLRRFGGELHLLDRATLAPLTEEWGWPPGQDAFSLGAWRLEPVADAPAPPAPASTPLLWRPRDAGPLRLVPATGGERLFRNGCHQRVSELWRAAGVPPWRRAQWPLVYEGDTLRCVPGVGVADAWRDRRLEVWRLEAVVAPDA